MGGTIQFVFRGTDGSISKRVVWTNSLPNYLYDTRIYNKDRSVIDEILEEPTIYDIPETENRIAPHEYGILIVDWLKNKIYSCNSYFTPDYINSIYFTRGDELSTNTSALRKMASDSRFMYPVTFSHNDGMTSHLEKAGDVNFSRNFNEFYDQCVLIEKTMNSYLVKIKIDTTPLEVVSFSNTEEGMNALKDVLIKDGFVPDNNWINENWFPSSSKIYE